LLTAFFSVFLPNVPPLKSWAKKPPPPPFRAPIPASLSARGVHGFDEFVELLDLLRVDVLLAFGGKAVEDEEAAEEDGGNGGDESLK
jgi:hypothetical protein